MLTDTSVTRDHHPLFWPISPNFSHKKLKEISERNCFWSGDWNDRIKKLSDRARRVWMCEPDSDWSEMIASCLHTLKRLCQAKWPISLEQFTPVPIFSYLHGRREAESKMSCRTKSDADRLMRSPARQPLDWSSRSFQFVKNYLKFGKKIPCFLSYHILTIHKESVAVLAVIKSFPCIINMRKWTRERAIAS